MKRLHQIVFVELVLGGIASFAVLWHSSFSIPTKILVGIAILFLGSAIYLLITQYLVFMKLQRQIATKLLQLESAVDDKVEPTSRFDFVGDDFTIHNHATLAKFLVWLFALWLFGGWVISQWLV